MRRAIAELIGLRKAVEDMEREKIITCLTPTTSGVAESDLMKLLHISEFCTEPRLTQYSAVVTGRLASAEVHAS